MSQEHDTSATPSHYTEHKITPIDLIHEYGLNFNLGCAIKHIARHKEKLGREDILKALWYILDELGMPRALTNWTVNAIKNQQWWRPRTDSSKLMIKISGSK